MVSIDRVKAGTYRLTVYADGELETAPPPIPRVLTSFKGIFGDFIQDDIVISAETVTSIQLDWIAESAGRIKFEPLFFLYNPYFCWQATNFGALVYQIKLLVIN